MSAARSQTHALARPLRLSRIPFAKVWGGRALERKPGIRLDIEGPVGETWELVDRADHSSLVAGGPLDGKSLRALMEEDRQALLGRAKPTRDGRFPLLLKLLSASQPLSVQVHPDDATARRMDEQDCGKSECWYILDAEPDSVVHLGLRPGVEAATFAAQAATDAVADLLQPWPVRAGDFVFVPAGTLHSIGAGISLVEVQQNSDITYRVYDWGRVGLDGKPRPTQLEQALLSIHYEAEVRGPVRPELGGCGAGNRCALLADCPFFRVELLDVGSRVDRDTAGCAVAYVITAGEGRIRVLDGGEALAIGPGDTWLLPAVAGEHRIEAQSERLEVLRVETKA